MSVHWRRNGKRLDLPGKVNLRLIFVVANFEKHPQIPLAPLLVHPQIVGRFCVLHIKINKSFVFDDRTSDVSYYPQQQGGYNTEDSFTPSR